MKKLKDLKDNECIKIESLKEAKYLIKRFFWNNTNPEEIINHYLHLSDGFYWDNQANETIYKLSQFIKSKPKTSKRLKQLEKKVDYLNDFVVNMKPKTESIHQQLSREEAAKHPNCIAKVNESGTGLVFEPAGNPELKDLEAGKWYKRTGWLYCIIELKGNIRVYGFNHTGEWTDDSILYSRNNMVEASKEEVEGALIIEAERRGFKQGVKVNRGMFPDIINDTVTLQSNNNKYIINEDSLEIGFYTIYNKGIWAEIIEQPKEIDWNVPGQLFSNKNGKIVLLSDGKHDKNTFNGTLIKGDIGGVGMYINKAYKNCYVKFNGSIILKND